MQTVARSMDTPEDKATMAGEVRVTVGTAGILSIDLMRCNR
jgi:hypothetical protein